MKYSFKYIVIFVVIVAMLSSCARVRVAGERVGSENVAHVTNIYQYSFLTMNPLGMKRLNKDLSTFNNQLADALRTKNFRVTAEEAQSVAAKNNLAINVTQYNQYFNNIIQTGSVGGKVIPVNDIIRSNRATEENLQISHRLILFPSMTTYTGPTANASADVRWWLQDARNDTVIAQGTIHYIADIRGFPGKDMAEQLTQKLEALGIRG